MKSLQLVAARVLEPRDTPDPPDPGPGEVLVRIRAVGICGSDMHHYLEGSVAGTVAQFPAILGHEPAGEIAGVGPGVENLKTGTRVAVEPAITCRKCEPCLSGHQNRCENSIFLGGSQQPGLLREYAVVPRRNVAVIPDDMDFPTATVAEPLAVLLHSLDLAKLQLGETVLVLGAGPIGLLAVAVSKLAGAGSIVVTDQIPERLALAKKMGADVAVNFSQESVADAVRDVTGGKGAHVIFDAAGKPESINDGLESARAGARMVVIGIPSQQQVPVNFWRGLEREITIHVQKRSNGNDHLAIEMLHRKLIDASALVSHRFPLEDGAKAFQAVAHYSDGVAKAVIEL
jgi:L-iditol 2-dehydrogenase